MIKNLFKKSFNIREGELKIALLMQLYIFLVITVLLLVKPTVTALFLSGLGPEKLPYGYLLVAVVAVLSSVFYNRMIKRFSIKVVALVTIIIFSTLFFLLSYVVYNEINAGWILYFYYISISLFGVLVTSQFWVVANIVFDLREAKRLFGFIGAGAIAGGIFGGYLTTFIANFFGNSIVSLIAAILLLLCIPIIFWIWKIRVGHLNKYIKEERKQKKESISSSSWSVVFKSKHLINLSAIVGVSVVVAKLVDYQFNDLSHNVYSDPDELASFFGFWFSSFNIIALLIQLFLTNRMMARFGVTTNMLFLPIGLAIGSFLFFIFPELWVMVLIKGMDGSFKQSLSKAAFELSILPVSYEVKKQAKPFIDVVVDSIATGLAGFLLLFLIHQLKLDVRYFSVIILFFLLIWIFLIFRLRESYFETFRKNIKEMVHSQGKGEKKKKKRSTHAMIDVLRSGTEQEILSLLRHLNKDLTEIFRPYLIALLDHPSDRVKANAIKKINDFGSKKVLKKIENLIRNNNDDEVVYEAMEYLLANSNMTKEQALYYLNHKKDYIKNAALLCLARSARYNPDLAKKYDLNHRIESQIKEFTSHENEQRIEEMAELLMTIGYYGKQDLYPIIEKYLDSKEPLLVKYAIKAAGLTRNDQFVDKLLELMVSKENHDDVVKALKGYGDSMVNLLYNKDRDEEFDENSRGFIPEIIQAFETKESVVMLLRLLRSKDVLDRLQSARALNKLEDNNHKLKISDKRLSENIFNECMYFKNTLVALQSVEKAFDKAAKSSKKNSSEMKKAQAARRKLLDHLQKQLDYSLETIFNLLGIKYSDSDMKVAYQGINNETEESRINTIEFLSNLLEVDLKRELLPLLEYRFLADGETDIDIKEVPENRSLINLLKEQGIVSKIFVLQLLRYIPHNSTKRILDKLSKHKNAKLRSLARKVIESEKDK